MFGDINFQRPSKESFCHSNLKGFVSHDEFFSSLPLPPRQNQGLSLMHWTLSVHEALSVTWILTATEEYLDTHIRFLIFIYHLEYNDPQSCFCNPELSSKSQIHSQMNTLKSTLRSLKGQGNSRGPKRNSRSIHPKIKTKAPSFSGLVLVHSAVITRYHRWVNNRN